LFERRVADEGLLCQLEIGLKAGIIQSLSILIPAQAGIQNPHCISPFAKGERKRG
jgi:hypothetical protein